MNLHRRLSEVVHGLPDGSAVMLPVEAVHTWLADESAGTDGPLGDLTLTQVATATGRAVSTIRTWANSGKLPGAYKLNGRDWRIPSSALRAFLDAQANGAGAHPTLDDREADLSAWRSERAG